MKGELVNKENEYFKQIEFKDIPELYNEIKKAKTLHYGGLINHFDEIWITKETLNILEADECFRIGELNFFFKMSLFNNKGSLIAFYGSYIIVKEGMNI